jgi:hypothetical protein
LILEGLSASPPAKLRIALQAGRNHLSIINAPKFRIIENEIGYLAREVFPRM